ncbi:MAG: DUF5686 family protein [Bacteroidota bacterium]
MRRSPNGCVTTHHSATRSAAVKLLPLFFCFSLLALPVCAQTDSTAVPAPTPGADSTAVPAAAGSSDSTFKFSGMVLDNETGEELQFIELSFDSLQTGTRTNTLGVFSIQLPPGTHVFRIEALGYENYRDTVVVDSANPPERKMIMLPPKSHEIEGTTIQYVNPAIRIMKLAIKHRKANRLRGLESYALKKYTKSALFFDNVSEKNMNSLLLRSSKDFVAQYKDDQALYDQDGKMQLMMFISEQISEHYFRAPNDKKQIILAEQSQGVDNLQLDQLTRLMITASIYDPVMDLLDKQFISPLSPTAFLSYKFAKMGQEVSGKDTTFKIELRPRNKYDYSFKGHIWVENKTWAVTKVDIETFKNTDFNFVEQIGLEQAFDTIGGHWVPTMRVVKVDFKNNENRTGLAGRAVEHIYDYRIDTSFPDKFFRGLEVELAKGAETRESAYWDSVRTVELSKKEQLGYALIESNQKKLFWKVMNGFTELFSTGGKRVGQRDQFVVGPYGQLIGFNPVEGWRSYFGLWSHPSLHPRWDFRTELGYGFGDRRLKYLGELTYVPSFSPRIELSAYHAYGVEQAGYAAYETDGGTGAAQTALMRIPFFNMNYFRETRFSYSMDVTKGVATNLYVKHKSFEPGFDFAFRGHTGSLRQTYQIAEVGGRLRLSLKEDYLIKYGEKVYLDSPFPVFYADYKYGRSGVLGSDFDYHHLALALNDRLNLGRFGWLMYTIKAGQIWGTLPFPLLYVYEGSQSWAMGRMGWSSSAVQSLAGTFNRTATYADIRFNLMYFYEFIADRYLAAGFDHHFDGYILRKIPLIRKLKWKSLATFRIGLGTLTEANRQMNTLDEEDPIFNSDASVEPFQQFVQAPTRPYMEMGVGIENILRLIRLDYIWRLSYQDPRRSDAVEGYLLRHGPRITISFSL